MEKVKQAEKRFNAFKTNRRRFKYFQADFSRGIIKAKYNEIDVERLKEKLEWYKTFLAEKYIESGNLSVLFADLCLGVAQNIEHAVKRYEEGKSLF